MPSCQLQQEEDGSCGCAPGRSTPPWSPPRRRSELRSLPRLRPRHLPGGALHLSPRSHAPRCSPLGPRLPPSQLPSLPLAAVPLAGPFASASGRRFIAPPPSLPGAAPVARVGRLRRGEPRVPQARRYLAKACAGAAAGSVLAAWVQLVLRLRRKSASADESSRRAVGEREETATRLVRCPPPTRRRPPPTSRRWHEVVAFVLAQAVAKLWCQAPARQAALDAGIN